MDGVANMPVNTQFAENMMHNEGFITHPMATGVRKYSSQKPSGLQNVMLPDYLSMAHADRSQMVMQDGSAPQTAAHQFAAPQMEYSQFANPQMAASHVTNPQMGATQFNHQQMQMPASHATHPQFHAQQMGTPRQTAAQYPAQQFQTQQFQTPQHLIQHHVPTPQGPPRYPQPNLLPQALISANPSGLSAARTPFGRGRKRSNPDASGATSTGSPQKRVRR
jgi:hypothetical protein